MTTQELAQASNTVLGIKRERLNDGATVKVWKSDGRGALREVRSGMKRGEMVVAGQGRKKDENDGF